MKKFTILSIKEENGSPKEPVQIPNNLPFNEFILTVWDDQLQIYAGNFTMRQPTEGDKVLTEIVYILRIKNVYLFSKIQVYNFWRF